ncbi:MAG: hypothetical protein L3J39_17185, partial [Verrucomicrobiales bacterium]|nr:hypothetical protein [Verrucomicrobiales bacterium]
TLSMVKEVQARRVALVSLKAENAVIEQHVREGGIGLIVEGEPGERQVLKLRDGGETYVIAEAGDLPATLGGRAQHNVFNALVASGLSYGLGLSVEQITAGLETFHNHFSSNPGRFNVFEEGDFTVIIDFAHNPEGVEAACDTVARMEVTGRCWVVLGTTGNRHGDHIKRAAQVVAGRFDRYLCTRDNTYSLEDDGVRGFPAEEIPKRLADELRKQGVEEAQVEEVSEFRAAVALGLDSCAEGDLLLIFTDEYDWCHERIMELHTRTV